jgi:hypothetical protein
MRRLVVTALAFALLLAAGVAAQEVADKPDTGPTVPAAGSSPRIDTHQRFRKAVARLGDAPVKRALEALPDGCAEVTDAYFAVNFGDECLPAVQATLRKLEAAQ